MTYTEPLTVSPAIYIILSVCTAKDTCALLLVLPILSAGKETRRRGEVVGALLVILYPRTSLKLAPSRCVNEEEENEWVGTVVLTRVE